MAIKQIVATLPFQDPTGTVLANGSLTLDLSQAATATGSGEVAPLRVAISLNTSGTFSATNLWANDQLQPGGTTYHLKAFNSNGLFSADYGQIQITGASPIDISSIVPSSSNPTTAVTTLNLQSLNSILFASQFSSIQAAINALPSTGGTVFVSAGTTFSAGVQLEMKSNAHLVFDAGTFTAPSNASSAIAVIHFATSVTGASVGGAGIAATAILAASSGTQFLAVIQDEGTDNTVENLTLNGNGNCTSALVLKQTTRPRVRNIKAIGDTTVVAGHNYCVDIRGGNNFEFSNVETSGGALGGFSIVTKDASGDYGSITGGNFNNLYLHASPHNGLDINVNASAVASANNINALNFSNVFSQGNGTLGGANDDVYGIVLNATLIGGDSGSMNNLNMWNVWAFNNAGTGLRMKGNVFSSVISVNAASNGTDGTATSTDAIVLATGNGTTHPQLNVITASGNKGSATNFISTQANSGTNLFIVSTTDPISLATSADSFIARGGSFQIGGSAVIVPTSIAVGSGSAFTSSGGGGTAVGQVANTSQKVETGADANVLTFTPPATAGTYRLRFVLSLSAANAATLGWTATWKDSNGAAQSPTNLSFFQEGTAGPSLTFTTSSVGNYYGDAQIDVDNSATNIVVKLTFSGTSFTGKASASIERII